MDKHHHLRRGAALIITLVLLAFIATIAMAALTQMLRERQVIRLDLARQQADLLICDALRQSEVLRQADPEFSGETITLGPEQQPFGGTFRVTTRYQEDRFVAEAEYRDEKGKVVHLVKR